MAAVKKAAAKAAKKVYVYSNDGDCISGEFDSVQEALNDADDEGNSSVTVFQKIAEYKIKTNTIFEEVK